MARSDSPDSNSRWTGFPRLTSGALGMALCVALVAACSSAAGPNASGTTGVAPAASAALTGRSTEPDRGSGRLRCRRRHRIGRCPLADRSARRQVHGGREGQPNRSRLAALPGPLPTTSWPARRPIRPTTTAPTMRSTSCISENPNDVEALIGQATIALARHQFADGLAIGQKALDAQPRHGSHLRRHRRRAERARPLRRRGRQRRHDGAHAAGPELLQPRLLRARAARRHPGRHHRHGDRHRGGRTRGREHRLPARDPRQPAVHGRRPDQGRRRRIARTLAAPARLRLRARRRGPRRCRTRRPRPGHRVRPGSRGPGPVPGIPHRRR